MEKKTTAESAPGESPAERWQQVKNVFLQAVASPADQRQAYLHEACGADQELLAEVNSLLNYHERAVAGGFLDDVPDSSSPRAVLEAMAAALDATSGTLQDVDPAEQPTQLAPGVLDGPIDDRFGDYRLLEQIGQGGMGVVYRARQVSLNRVVALKMIRAGRFSTQSEIERFALEAEAAAGLTHPGIVPIFEVGAEEGHHYYTMPLVDGLSLADQLQEAGGPLEPKHAANLIHQVALAVQYAHEHGVIHRDLKPANILLDDQGIPRVVDFGLAKQMETESGLTYTGQVLGTPSFMSPEQAAGETASVGQAADIYALGAVLYAMLTGRPPFNAASVTETLRQVQHDQPVSPRQLNSALPKDLETLCLKCLEKDPAKRYLSAEELANELTRFLAGRPILARPVGVGTTAVRWCRRNPLAASFITFLAIFIPAVVAALVAMNLELAAKSTLAEASFLAAKNAVDEQFTLVSEETLLDRPGLQPLRRNLLQGAGKYYQKFLELRGNDPDLKTETAKIHYRLGVITAMLNSGDDQDAYAQAQTHFATARQLYEAFPDPNDPRVLEGLGDVWNRIGHVCNRLRQEPQELAAFRTAIDFRQRVMEVQPTDENLRRLANAHMNLGQALISSQAPDPPAQRQAGMEQLEMAQAIRRRLLIQDPDNVRVVSDQAKGYVFMADACSGDPVQVRLAPKYLNLAMQLMEDQAQHTPPGLEDTFLRAIIAKRLGGITADMAVDLDDLNRARDYFDQALGILQPLAADNPQVIDYLSALAATHHESALVYLDLQSDEDAGRHLQTAIDLLAPLIKGRNPDDILRWAGAHTLLAELDTADAAKAGEHLHLARALLADKLAEISADAGAEAVRAEYQGAIEEIDAMLAEREGT